MTELDPITDRLDQICQELRRQGRAAVAAQAAAEACLSGVERVDATLSEMAHDQPLETDQAKHAVLGSLLPVFDALLRVAREAERLEPQRPQAWPLSLLGRDRNLERLRSMCHGVRLLDAAFRQAVDHLGIVIEDRVGATVNPEIHRVLESREPTPSEREDTVIEVVRCGYLRGDTVLREADVIATRMRTKF